MRLGSDPEVFLENNTGLVPVFGLVGGTKDNPKQVDGMPQGFTFQEDNVALEFGIPPAASKELFRSHIKDVQKAFLDRNPTLTFSKLSCALFPKTILDFPQAHIFGCEPDFNAWTGKENPPVKVRTRTMRAAGGHVHVELPEESDKRAVAQAMDFYLAIPALLMDKDIQRRRLYGKAGAFRPKPYGVEYRVLSNFWIFEDKYIDWVWDNTKRALDSVGEGEEFIHAATDIQRIINTGAVEEAKILIQAYDLEVV
jgi:hypothetical protein